LGTLNDTRIGHINITLRPRRLGHHDHQDP
jgi:hypothetical protein